MTDHETRGVLWIVRDPQRQPVGVGLNPESAWVEAQAFEDAHRETLEPRGYVLERGLYGGRCHAPVAWHCPACGRYYDTRTEPDREEYTVGSAFPASPPHVKCPACGECMGCRFMPPSSTDAKAGAAHAGEREFEAWVAYDEFADAPTMIDLEPQAVEGLDFPVRRVACRVVSDSTDHGASGPAET